mmetsp:Transcript_39854/g.105677  ORF Transcript_39854/g.105677 Transcript_39854/m.105677 type:complete len:253 (+) Transcript_39854:642-1400(+)
MLHLHRSIQRNLPPPAWQASLHTAPYSIQFGALLQPLKIHAGPDRNPSDRRIGFGGVRSLRLCCIIRTSLRSLGNTLHQSAKIRIHPLFTTFKQCQETRSHRFQLSGKERKRPAFDSLPAHTTNAVTVELDVCWEVIVHDIPQSCDVETSGCHVCGHQGVEFAHFEILQCLFALQLGNLRVHRRAPLPLRLQKPGDGSKRLDLGAEDQHRRSLTRARFLLLLALFAEECGEFSELLVFCTHMHNLVNRGRNR